MYAIKIEDLIEESKQYDEAKSDALKRPSSLQFENGMLYSDGFNVPLMPTDWCLGQIAQKLNIPPAYLRRCPRTLQDDNLNYWMKALGDGVDDLLRLRVNGESLRAFLSSKYVPIDNTDILVMVKDLLDESGKPYDLVRPSITPDGMNVRVKVLDDVGPDGNYGIGAYIHNGETGNRGLMVAPFVQRNSCTNSIVHAGEAWKIRHIHYTLGFIKAGIKEHVGKAFNMAGELLSNIVEAQAQEIPDLGQTIDDLAKKYKMTQDERTSVLIGTENNQTRMGVINGITFMSQTLADPDRTLQFEALAGALLAEPGSLFGKAALKAERALVDA